MRNAGEGNKRSREMDTSRTHKKGETKRNRDEEEEKKNEKKRKSPSLFGRENVNLPQTTLFGYKCLREIENMCCVYLFS